MANSGNATGPALARRASLIQAINAVFPSISPTVGLIWAMATRKNRIRYSPNLGNSEIRTFHVIQNRRPARPRSTEDLRRTEIVRRRSESARNEVGGSFSMLLIKSPRTHRFGGPEDVVVLRHLYKG